MRVYNENDNIDWEEIKRLAKLPPEELEKLVRESEERMLAQRKKYN